ncbi:MAG: PIN domain-containing protein [Caldilineaceae bacterium]
MAIDQTTPIFFDASCLIAAAGSPTGGSGFLLSLCEKGHLQAVISTYVMAEAARNIQTRMKPAAWANYQVLLVTVPIIIVPIPNPLPSLPPVNAKDIHVVAAAVAAGCAYLVTLDKGLLAEANQAQPGFPTLLPGDFIKTVLPTHIDFPNLR